MKAIVRLTCLVWIAMSLVSCEAKTISGKVIKVLDGDTIVVLQHNRQFKIRLDGVDCPEYNQAYGNRAKQFTSTQVFGRYVKVGYKSQDRYGRYLGTVYYAKGKNLCHELLKSGLAWHYKHYNKDKTMANLEAVARNKRVGLWADRQPVPPWIFRKY